MPSIKAGQTKTFAVTATDGAVVGQVTAIPDHGGLSVVMNADNTGTVTGVTVGNCNITFTCTGYNNVVVTYTVTPKPTLIFTET